MLLLTKKLLDSTLLRKIYLTIYLKRYRRHGQRILGKHRLGPLGWWHRNWRAETAVFRAWRGPHCHSFVALRRSQARLSTHERDEGALRRRVPGQRGKRVSHATATGR